MMPMACSQALELGRRPETQRLAQVERVVKRGALITEHDVISPGDAHDVGTAGHAEHREQRIHVILIGFRVVSVADITPHRETQQLPAEVVLQPRPQDLFAVIKVLRPDEADDRVHQEGVKTAGDRIGPRLAGLLIDPVVRAG